MQALEDGAIRPLFFICEKCGSATESEQQSLEAAAENRRLCIYKGSRPTRAVLTKCLVCKDEQRLRSNLVYRKTKVAASRMTTQPKDRLDDPTLPRIELKCPFDACRSRAAGKLALAVFSKTEDEAKFQLLYTCSECSQSWTA